MNGMVESHTEGSKWDCEDIATTIASHVSDQDTLRNLSLVTRTWSNAAMPKLWENLDFTGLETQEPRSFKALRLLSALQSNVRRRNLVKFFDVRIGPDMACVVAEIVRDLPNLRGLRVAFRGEELWDDTHVSEWMTQFSYCVGPHPQLDKLQDLRMQVGEDWAYQLRRILLFAPNVRGIQIDSHALLQDCELDPAIWPSFPHLTSLNLLLARPALPFLAMVVGKAPNLQHLCLNNGYADSLDTRDDSSISTISLLKSCESLRSLSIHCSGRRFSMSQAWATLFDGRSETFRNVTTVELSVGSVSEIFEGAVDTPQKDCVIPPLQHMTVLVISWFDYGTDIPMTRRIHQIVRAPKLIRIFVTNGPTDIERLQNNTPLNVWCPAKVRGYLIRSYRNGSDSLVIWRGCADSPSLAPRDQDWSDPSEHEATENVRDNQHEWVTEAYFNVVHIVPETTLKQIYALLGQGSDWEEPGRDLELPTEAWALLRQLDA